MVGGGHGRDVREGIYVYIWLIHFVVQQRLTQHCKAIILHFKKKERRKWAELGCSEHRWAALWEKGHLLQGPHLRSNKACSSCFHFIHLILLPSASQFPINRPASKHFCFCTRRIIVYNYKDVLWFCVLYPPPASPIFMFFFLNDDLELFFAYSLQLYSSRSLKSYRWDRSLKSCRCLVAKSCPSFLIPWAIAHSLLYPCGFSGKSTEMGCHFFLQEIFPTQRSNLHLLNWQVNSLPPSHRGSPQTL